MEITIGKPNVVQEKALKDSHKIIGYGGARGGGKSWFIRAKAILLALAYPGIRMMIVRKTYNELIENHVKPLKQTLKIGTDGCPIKYNDSRKEITFPNGSTLMLRYCSNEADCDRYQGLEIDILFIDESTQMEEIVIKKLSACVRGVNDFPKHVYLTCNPGGVSHGYHKRIFIDKQYIDGENPDDYSFHKALVTDNYALMKMQPEYLKALENLPDALRQAWLFGDWQIFEGCYFSEFREQPDITQCEKHGVDVETARDDGLWTHVIEPFDIPPSWKIWRSYDWGYGKPFAMTYYAMPPGDDTAYMILEVYGCTKTPNEGIKWTSDEQFAYFRELEDTHPYFKGKRIQGVADPSIWDGSKGISVAQSADKYQIWMQPGVNDRIPGWLQVRERLKFDENGRARLYIFNTCKHTIRTIPLQMFDEHKVEDLDSSLEDHIEDSIRYFCMMNPVNVAIPDEQIRPISDPLNQFTKTKSMIRRY